MKLADKMRYLREIEGSLRGLNRALTQQELVRAIASEMDSSLSQSYLSQIESGARPHLTNTSRLLLAKFFRVHPGYLVDDPEGYHAELLSDLRTHEDKLDLWLVAGSERFHKDAELAEALRSIAFHDRSRDCLLLLEAVLETPGLGERLLEVLRPGKTSSAAERLQQSTVPLAPRVVSPQLSSAARASAEPSRKTTKKRASRENRNEP